MNASQENKKRDWLKLSRVIIGVIVLALIACYVDLGQFVQTLASVNPSVFGILLLVVMLSRLLRAYKWNSLLRARGIHISNWQALRLSLVSHFTGSWTPGQIGGDAYRIYALKDFGRSSVVLSTVLIERYAGLCAVSFFALLSMPVTMPYLYRKSPFVLAIVFAAIVLVAGVVPCLFSRRLTGMVSKLVPGFGRSGVGRKISQFYDTLAEFRHHEGTLVFFAIATLLEVLSYFVTNWLAARALGLEADLLFFMLAMPIVHLLLRIPISFQSLGIQEGCFVYALVAHGFSPAEGLAVSILQRTLEWIMSIVPGGLLLWLTNGPQPEPGNGVESNLSDSTFRRATADPSAAR